jgi:hypothetical protein
MGDRMKLFPRLHSATPVPEPRTERLFLNAEPFTFYELGEGFALFNEPQQAGILTVGPRIPVACMFEVYWLTRNGQKVGHYFVSQFQTVNHGAYVVTFLNNGVGKASLVEVTLKTDTLVVYNYPNRGALIVCPVLSDDLLSIFEEQ